MVSFELGKEIEKDVFRLVTSVGQKFWVPMRNRTSDPWTQYRAALPLSHRDSTVGEVYYEVHMICVLRTAMISNVNELTISLKLFTNMTLSKRV